MSILKDMRALCFLAFLASFFWDAGMAFSLANDEEAFCSSYHPKLSLAECVEFRDISENYSSYDDRYKNIALIRIRQLQQKALSVEERAKIMLGEIEGGYFGDVPIDFMGFVTERRNVFTSLSWDIKLELVIDSIYLQEGKVGQQKLSEVANSYKESRNPFILVSQ